MKISVAMTTYNGEKFVLKQLNSLREQTQKIDEVLIFDDGSTDKTINIINDYINSFMLCNWKLYEKCNDGWIINFYKCIKETTGDIVFFCDQDDIWEKTKIEEMSKILLQNNDIKVLACRLSLIDSDDKPINDNHEKFPFDSKETSNLYLNKFDKRFTYTISPGCTLAVKKEYIDKYNEYILVKNIPHDALYWKIGTLNNEAYILDKSLLKYRIHLNNTSKPTLDSNYQIKKETIRIDENIKSKLDIIKIKDIYKNSNDYSIEVLENLDSIINFHNNRDLFLKHKKSSLLFIIKFISYYRNYKMLIGDILSRF